MNNKNEYDLYKMVKENYNINRDDIYIKDILTKGDIFNIYHEIKKFIFKLNQIEIPT